jgi:hypothetical protein
LSWLQLQPNLDGDFSKTVKFYGIDRCWYIVTRIIQCLVRDRSRSVVRVGAPDTGPASLRTGSFIAAVTGLEPEITERIARMASLVMCNLT